MDTTLVARAQHGDEEAFSCWNDKYYRNFWRPITAIREADTDGNPATAADPTWTPPLATPAFPDHPVRPQLRVWGGIHFRTADMQGSVIGKKVAHWLVKHYFGPVE